MSELFLKGRVAWVTGGASGTGRAIALALAEAGADVAIGSLLAQDGKTRPANFDTYFPNETELDEMRTPPRSRHSRSIHRSALVGWD